MNPGDEKELLRKEALAFLKAHTTGTFSTVAPDGTPRARTVYFASDKTFAIYFVTLANTRKWEDVQAHARGSFVVSEEKVPRTLQIEGTITNLTKTALIDPALVELTIVLLSNTNYFAPITRFSPGDMVFLKLTPTWVRWGDFSEGRGTNEVMRVLVP
ncbi:pyridoxamine 5'-phosphate oxidase family protein [Patescibacteria group bacterium]|nr:pyridoxamine 5'-phosphate oxidase family protein [Patescibacteria group bacterium]